MGQAPKGGKGWITVRQPMDGASRFRIVIGGLAIIVAALASLALLNILLAEPLPTGDGPGDDGGPSGDPGDPFQPPDNNQGGGEEGGGENQGGGGRKNPCDIAKPALRAAAITALVLSMALWVLAVWWRQKKETRVMNAWAITAVVFTLIAVTLLFAWWIVHKICSLDIRDLRSCLELANSMRNAFIMFLIPGIGLIVFAILRKQKGQAFWGLWSGAGLMFLYLAILAMSGWLVAKDMCERTFEEPDIEDLPDPNDPPDGGNNGDPGGDPGGEPGGDPGDPGNSGGDPGGGGGGDNGGRGGGGGGRAAPNLPQVSPFMLLVLLAIAAIVTVIVLAVQSRKQQMGRMAMAAAKGGRAKLIGLFTETDLESTDRVVAAYREFLDHCLLHDVEKLETETPREHGKRAAKALKLDYETMQPLLDAYLLTRLGDRKASDNERNQALAFLRRLKSGTVRAVKVPKAPKEDG